MARGVVPMDAGGGIVSRVVDGFVTLVVIIALFAVLVHNPGGAAHFVMQAVHVLGAIVGALITFVRDLVASVGSA